MRVLLHRQSVRVAPVRRQQTITRSRVQGLPMTNSRAQERFLQLPANTQVTLIDSAEQLEASRYANGCGQGTCCNVSVTKSVIQFPCRVSICVRHRRRMAAQSGSCDSHLAAIGICWSCSAAATGQLCIAAGELCKVCCVRSAQATMRSS